MICSVAIRIDSNPAIAENAIAEIQNQDSIETGTRNGQVLPAVIDTPDPVAMEDITRWIQELDGVIHVDVVYVDFEGADEAPVNAQDVKLR